MVGPLADRSVSTFILDAIHVAGLTLVVGFAVLLDLRLLGVLFVRRKVSEVLRQLNPWLFAGLGVMAVTGMLLFFGDPLKYYAATAFRLKMFLILLAGLNVWIFNSTVGRRVEEWDLAPKTPVAAKVGAIISLMLWAAIVTAGSALASRGPLS